MFFYSPKTKFLCRSCRSIQELSTARNLAHTMSRQIRPLSRNTDSDIEIVEDSEPERVQLRHKSANDAGLLQSISTSGMHQRTLNNVGLHTTATVIEISGVCKSLISVWTTWRYLDSESSNSSCGKNTIIYGVASGAVNVNPGVLCRRLWLDDLSYITISQGPPTRIIKIHYQY